MMTGILAGAAMLGRDAEGTFGGAIIVVSDGIDSWFSAQTIIDRVRILTVMPKQSIK